MDTAPGVSRVTRRQLEKEIARLETEIECAWFSSSRLEDAASVNQLHWIALAAKEIREGLRQFKRDLYGVSLELEGTPESEQLFKEEVNR